MTKVGNIKEGKTPTYDEIVDTTLRQEGDRAARRMERPGLPDGGVLTCSTLRRAPPHVAAPACHKKKTARIDGIAR